MWYHARDRRQALPDRRHLVADGDRRNHDHAAARRGADQARLGDAAVPRHRRRDARRRRASRSQPPNGGFLAVRKPWPGMLRGIWGDNAALRADTTGASGRTPTSPATARTATSDGYFWIMGRIDDVMNVSGHRIGTMEVESALVSHATGGRGRGGRAARRAHRHRDRRVRHAARRHRRRARRSPTELREHVAQADRRASRSPTTSASPTRCRRRARARSCGGCCATSPPARRRSATRPRSRIYSVLAKIRATDEE